MDFVEFGLINFVPNIRLPAINCCIFVGAGIRIFEAHIKMPSSNAMKADCIIWHAETKSPTKVKRMFRAKSTGRTWQPRKWKHQGMKLGSSPRHVYDRERTVNQELIFQIVRGNPKQSLRRVSNNLGVSVSGPEVFCLKTI